jgi:hypothetical protein
MPPRRGHPVGTTGYPVGTTGYPIGTAGFRSITARVYDTYMAYIIAIRQYMWIDMFRTADEAARTYADATAWRFGRAQSELNFPDVK